MIVWNKDLTSFSCKLWSTSHCKMTINEAVLNPFSTNECSTSTPPENVRKPPVFSKSPNLLEKMVFYYHGTKNFGYFFLWQQLILWASWIHCYTTCNCCFGLPQNYEKLWTWQKNVHINIKWYPFLGRFKHLPQNIFCMICFFTGVD